MATPFYNMSNDKTSAAAGKATGADACSPPSIWAVLARAFWACCRPPAKDEHEFDLDALDEQVKARNSEYGHLEEVKFAKAWIRSAHACLQAPKSAASKVCEVYLYKINCCGTFWHYRVAFHDVILDFGRGNRGGFYIPGSGIQVHERAFVEGPDEAVLLGSVDLNVAKSAAMEMALSGEWGRGKYRFAYRNCQCFVEEFCTRLGLSIEGDQYLQSKRYVEGWMKRSASTVSTASSDDEDDDDDEDSE